MAKTHGPLFSIEARGTFADVMTFSKRNTVNICRYQRKQKDVITAARTIQRASFNNARAAWALLTDAEKAIYEAEAVSLKVSPYNLFMKYYMSDPPSYWRLFSKFEQDPETIYFYSDDKYKQEMIFPEGGAITNAAAWGGFTSAGLTPHINNFVYVFYSQAQDIAEKDFFLSAFFNQIALPTEAWSTCFQIASWKDSNCYWMFQIILDDDGIWNVQLYINSVSKFWIPIPTPVVGTWYKIELQKIGTSVFLFFNNVQIYTMTETENMPLTEDGISIATEGQAYVDDLRLLVFD